MFSVKQFSVPKGQRIMQQINTQTRSYSPTHVITRDDANNKYILYEVTDNSGTLQRLDSKQSASAFKALQP